MTNLFMTRAKNVLLLTSHYPPNLGGVESHLTALVSALTKRNWKVVVSTYQPLAAKKSAPYFEKYKDLKIYRFPWLGFNIVHKLTPYPPLEFLYLFPGLLLMSFIILIKYQKEIDVIHAQGLVPTAIGVFMKIIFRKRLVSSIHNLYFFPKRGLYPKAARFIFSSADVVLAPTQVAANELARIGVSRKKIGKFSYWLSLEVFKPIKKSLAKSKIGWKLFTVFFVGRLIETKGVNMILVSQGFR